VKGCFRFRKASDRRPLRNQINLLDTHSLASSRPSDISKMAKVANMAKNRRWPTASRSQFPAKPLAPDRKQPRRRKPNRPPVSLPQRGAPTQINSRQPRPPGKQRASCTGYPSSHSEPSILWPPQNGNNLLIGHLRRHLRSPANLISPFKDDRGRDRPCERPPAQIRP
jgi:hypothetical protein